MTKDTKSEKESHLDLCAKCKTNPAIVIILCGDCATNIPVCKECANKIIEIRELILRDSQLRFEQEVYFMELKWTQKYYDSGNINYIG